MPEATAAATPPEPTASGATVPASGVTAPEAANLGTIDPAAESEPPVRLGMLLTGGLAPAMLGLVERGVRRRPGPARALRAEIEMATVEEYPPVRIQFGEDEIVVEDGPAGQPDARIRGPLADLIALTVSPAVGGIPLPVNARGRAALGMVVSRRVRIEGSLTVVRRLLTVIRV